MIDIHISILHALKEEIIIQRDAICKGNKDQFELLQGQLQGLERAIEIAKKVISDEDV